MSDKLKTHKFARKPFYVDAVRVSADNIEKVAEWCGGEIRTDEEGKHVKVNVYRPQSERQSKAYVGDWVLYSGSGYKCYTPKSFDKSFEKVRTLTKPQADAAGITVPHEKRQPRKLSKAQADAEGIEAPREESKPPEPVPSPPKQIEKAEIYSVSFVAEEPNPANGVYPIESMVVEEQPKKDSVDRLFDEVLKDN
jgi:hypothetical protein